MHGSQGASDCQRLTLAELRRLSPRGRQLYGAYLRQYCFAAARIRSYKILDSWLLDCDLSDTMLTNVLVCHSYVRSCEFSNASVRHASFQNCRFDDCTFTGAQFEKVDMKRCHITGASWQRSSLRGLGLRESRLTLADLTDSDLGGARLRDSMLSEVNLEGANLAEGDLRDTVFLNCRLRGCDLTGAQLSDTLFYECQGLHLALGLSTLPVTARVFLDRATWAEAGLHLPENVVAAIHCLPVDHLRGGRPMPEPATELGCNSVVR